MITPADVLFAWDARHGAIPTVGGQPSFSRGGDKWVRIRSRGGGPLYQRVRGDQVGFSWVEKDGVLLPRRALDLELASTPLNGGSADWGASGTHAVSWSGAVTDAGDVFADLPAGVSGGLWVNDSGAFAQNVVSLGMWSGADHVLSVIIEEGDTPQVGTAGANALAGMFDGTAGTWRIRFGYEFDTETVNISFGTLVLHEILAQRGPNGGKVVRVAVAVDGANTTAGNNRDWRLPRLNAGEDLYIHHVQVEERIFATSPIPYAGTPVTRPADQCFVEPIFPPQDFAFYAMGVLGTHVEGENRNWFDVGHRIGRPGVEFREDSNSPNGYEFVGSDVGSEDRVVGVQLADPQAGDVLEAAGSYERDTGRIFLTVRLNGGSPVSDDHLPGTWSAPSDWKVDRLALNEAGSLTGTNRGSQRYGRLLFAALSPVDTPDDDANAESFLDELADVPIGPQQAGHPG